MTDIVSVASGFRFSFYLLKRDEELELSIIKNKKNLEIKEGKITINEFKNLVYKMIIEELSGNVTVLVTGSGYTIGNNENFITVSNRELFEKEDWVNEKNITIYKENGSITIV